MSAAQSASWLVMQVDYQLQVPSAAQDLASSAEGQDNEGNMTEQPAAEERRADDQLGNGDTQPSKQTVIAMQAGPFHVQQAVGTLCGYSTATIIIDFAPEATGEAEVKAVVSMAAPEDDAAFVAPIPLHLQACSGMHCCEQARRTYLRL